MSMVFPVGIKMEGKKCLVIGGGSNAHFIAKTLINCGGEVTVMSMEPCRARSHHFQCRS